MAEGIRIKPPKPSKPPKGIPPIKRRKPFKAPRKPVKAPGKPPKGKPPKKRKKAAKPKKAKPPEKVPLPQIFGKNRDEILTPIRGEMKARIVEAEALIRQAQMKGFGPSDLSEIGYEYYQLIAAIEKMSPHDIYTLFMSPSL